MNKPNTEEGSDSTGNVVGSQRAASSLQQRASSSAVQDGETDRVTTITRVSISTQYDAADAVAADTSSTPLIATTKGAESKPKTDYSTDTLSGETLYQLLAMFFKLHDDRASQSDLTDRILKFLDSKLNRPGDSIKKGISQCRDNTDRSTSKGVSAGSKPRSSKAETRGIRVNPNSSSNTVSAS